MSVDATRVSLLVRLQQGGSEQDWEEFNKFYWGLIRSWARLFKCPEPTVEDIYQNTMLALMAALPNFKHTGDPGCFRKWLKTIVQRRVYDYFRWEMKHAERPGTEITGKWRFPGAEYGEQKDPDSEREAAMDRIWLQQLMDLAIDNARKRVKPEKFESFRRYVIYQESVDRVSKDMGIRVGTIFQHKSSFLDVLREEFMRLLDGLNDLGPAMANDAQARKQLKNVLEDYIQSRKELRNTMIVSEKPKQQNTGAINVLRSILDRNPAPGSGSYYLLIKPDKTFSWYTVKDEIKIGTGSYCKIQLEGEGVSAHHASINRNDEGELIAKDENSTNGLFLNGRRIGEWPLHPGDWLQVNNYCIIYLQFSE